MTANGEDLPNRVERKVDVVTDEGHRCITAYAGARRSNACVGRMCDAGHQVVFNKNGVSSAQDFRPEDQLLAGGKRAPSEGRSCGNFVGFLSTGR